MTKTKGFELLEHTADAYIAAYGTNMKEAFENAALAMFDVMTDAAKISPTTEDSVVVEATDEHALLYSWLEALLVKFDTQETLYSKFRILKLEKTPEGFKLTARVWGEKFDPRKHLQKVGVKAATYHRMEIFKDRDKVTLKFILDI